MLAAAGVLLLLAVGAIVWVVLTPEGARLVLTRATHMMGEGATLGSVYPLAAGSALAAKMRKTGQVALADFGDGTAARGTFHETMVHAAAWKLPLIERVFEGGDFSGKPSTPYARDSVHDFMHAKVTVCDDTVFLGSFNLSHSGEQNAENVLEIRDEQMADRMASFVDSVRAHYPAAPLPGPHGKP